MNFKKKLYKVTGGLALELLKGHLAELDRTQKENRALAEKYGFDRLSVWDDSGTIGSVAFPGAPHPDFRKNKHKKGTYFPRRGSQAYADFTALEGYDSPAQVISKAFNIPLSVGYTTKDGSEGWARIGYPLRECGFLYCSVEGPYAMWIPDVFSVIEEYQDEGTKVQQEVLDFKMPEDLEPMLDEEWKLIVAQFELEQKQKELENATHPK